MRACSQDGCTNAHRAKGLCSTHYNKQPGQHKYPRQTCPSCDNYFWPTRRPQTFCSLTCAHGGTPPDVISERRRQYYRDKQRRRRAAERSEVSERFTEAEIYARDRWRCFCRRKVDPNLRWPHPRSASLDHIVPLSEDPDGHTRANVRLAHLDCNVARSNRGGGEQLALIG